jgi:5-methylphenazine-1-carboxylate 1-monooxygenase
MEIAKNNKRVIIAGGGIGGLALALTLHQIGIQCIVFESVRQIQPLGVGINIQPNAVRELFELGIGPEVLDQVGIQAQEWALVGLNGKDIYAEPRGYEGRLSLATVRGTSRQAACTAV